MILPSKLGLHITPPKGIVVILHILHIFQDIYTLFELTFLQKSQTLPTFDHMTTNSQPKHVKFTVFWHQFQEDESHDGKHVFLAPVKSN